MLLVYTDTIALSSKLWRWRTRRQVVEKGKDTVLILQLEQQRDGKIQNANYGVQNTHLCRQAHD